MKQPLRGVNLGGWLVIEKWITPSLFKDVSAADEHGLMMNSKTSAKIERHRQKFITEKDFIWLRDHGIQALRIPVGYWLFEETPPFIPGQSYLDWAFDMAEKYEMKILISLHGAPGSQNGKTHSGLKGKTLWYKHKNRLATRGILAGLAERYGQWSSLWGVEILNEPQAKTVLQQLRLWWWTRTSIGWLNRKYPNVRFVYSDAFNPMRWAGVARGVLDIHHYQCFSASDKRRNLAEHIKKALSLQPLLRTVASIQPVIIGEWSASLDGSSLKGTPRSESEPQFVAAQLQAFEPADAWFYWTYKTEDKGSWSFRDVVARGSFDK